MDGDLAETCGNGHETLLLAGVGEQRSKWGEGLCENLVPSREDPGWVWVVGKRIPDILILARPPGCGRSWSAVRRIVRRFLILRRRDWLDDWEIDQTVKTRLARMLDGEGGRE